MWNICQSGIQNLISPSNFNSGKMWRADKKSRRTSWDWMELFVWFSYCSLKLFHCWIKFLLRSQDLVVCLGIFVLLLLQSIEENMPGSYSKVLTKRKLIVFDDKFVYGYPHTPPSAPLPSDFCSQAVFYGIMCYLRKSFCYKICNSALLNVYE